MALLSNPDSEAKLSVEKSSNRLSPSSKYTFVRCTSVSAKTKDPAPADPRTLLRFTVRRSTGAGLIPFLGPRFDRREMVRHKHQAPSCCQGLHNPQLLTSSQVPRNQKGPSRPSIQRSHSRVSKASLISPTPSIEGDDEDSSLDFSGPAMERQAQAQAQAPSNHQPEFEDEDTRLTSRKELAGWYSYGWAAEVFAICAMGTEYIRLPQTSNSGWLTFGSIFLAYHSRTTGARSGSPAS